MGLFYFAHPYTVTDKAGRHLPQGEEANFRLCCQRAGELLLRGYHIYSPISHFHPIHLANPTLLRIADADFWYKLDLHFIKSVAWEGLILAPDWRSSRGCQLERAAFEARALPIYDYEELLNTSLSSFTSSSLWQGQSAPEALATPPAASPSICKLCGEPLQFPFHKPSAMQTHHSSPSNPEARPPATHGVSTQDEAQTPFL